MADAAGELERGRGSYAKRAWTDARETLLQADLATPLGAEDLEQLATADYMLGREDEWITALERAHHAYLEAADPLQAVRCAFWVGMSQALRGDMAQASGWLGRAQRLLEREGDCVERGYLLLPLIFQREATGDFAGAAETAAQATEIGQRFGDADLFALAIHAQGQMLVQDGRLKDGLALLDEAMITVTGAEEVSPIVAGLVYCGVILACQQAYELRRAQEWTAALTRWCERQQDLVAFTGRCLTHRAEVMQAQGAWQEALEEARRAARRLEETSNLAAAGLAFYRQGELHRLQGDFAPAEEAYREASRCGWEPQPGLALLRAAQGRLDAAASSMRRVLVETDAQMKRAGLLPAFVEIMLASGSRDEAREACLELDEIARRHESGMLEAMAGQTRGALALSDGDARAALPALRRASQTWQELDAPYDVARTRVLVAEACRALGDEDAATLELEAAHKTFSSLGAAPDLARVGSLAGRPGRADEHGLTARELEVLRLIAAGRTNREIASGLVISEHTVARHVQNIFRKLGISSRSSATAFAFEHDLV